MRISLPLTLSNEELFTLFGIAVKSGAKYVCLDSRIAEKEDLFFSLIDSENHIAEAVKRGAVYAGGKHALAILASYIREKINPTVIAVTGSVGKTTVKEYIHAALSRTIKAHKSSKNNNNDIGVPISILSMPPNTRALVLELGTNHCGEIEHLSDICRPDIAVITNIGTSHIGTLGSRKNIIREKLSVLSHTKADGIFIHLSDLPVPNGFDISQQEIVVGFNDEKYDFTIKDVTLGHSSKYTLNSCEIHIPSESEHAVTASSLALAVCSCMGIDIGQKFSFLFGVDMPKMRQNIYCQNGMWIIDDCYNSSLESADSALALLKSFADARSMRKIAVLGDILECGIYARKIHEALAALCIKHGVDVLITYGNDSVYTAAAALALGMGQDRVFFLSGDNHRAVAGVINSIIGDSDVVLFKASRGMKCEKIIEYIKEENC